MNVSRWLAMLYRFVVSLTFSSIVIVTSTGEGTNLEQFAIWLLFSLTLVMSFLFSAFSTVIFTSNSDRRGLTLDRSAANLAAGWMKCKI